MSGWSGPSTRSRSAWVINRLIRSDPGVPAQLTELGDELRAAQGSLDGAAIRDGAVALDGEAVVTAHDAYSPDTRHATLKLGGHDLSAGQHTLEVRTVGKNPRSTGVYMGLDALTLRR